MRLVSTAGRWLAAAAAAMFEIWMMLLAGSVYVSITRMASTLGMHAPIDSQYYVGNMQSQTTGGTAYAASNHTAAQLPASAA
jgi:hypothetical protein